MRRLGERHPSVLVKRALRRPRLQVEPLESRRLLSASTADAAVAPLYASADFGGPGGLGGSGGATGGVTNPTPASSALTAIQLAAAYSLNLSSTTGSGETIAIVDAYNDPNIKSDLATFDSQYGLAAANLTVENQSGQTTNLPQTSPSWALEIALDVEWAHAAAPGAKLILVEANSSSVKDLMAAVQTAAKQANVVSMSWGSSEFAGETAYDTAAYFANPNVTFVAASGDVGGAGGAEWPAVSPDVVSVGGTTLKLTSSGTISSETAWSVSGSARTVSGSARTGYSGSTGGTSVYESVPSYQASLLGSSVKKRETPDVASDANPSTGLSVYDSVAGTGQTGWFEVGGTSAGAPVWAGIIAAADQARAGAGQSALSSTQTLNLVYGIAQTSAYATDFHDITSGSNLAGSATKGYDQVTGLGSPVASQLISAAASAASTTASAVKSASASSVTTATTTTTRASASVQALSVTISPAVPGAVSAQVFLAAGTDRSTASNPPVSAPPTAAAGLAVSVPAPGDRVGQAIPVSAAPVLGGGGWSPQDMPEASASSNQPGLVPTGGAQAVVGHAADGVPASAALIFPIPCWDAAVAAYPLETGGVGSTWIEDSTPSAPLPALAVNLDEVDLGPSPLLLAGVAIAAWGVWEYRSRRSDRDRFLWSPTQIRLDSTDRW